MSTVDIRAIQVNLLESLVYPAESPTHGMGLFAAAPIPADTVLGFFATQPTTKPGPYTLHCWDDSMVDVIDEFRFINHARPANVIYYSCDFSVVALRDIEQGEELFHDYGDDW